jgi:hypothetical protein
MYVLGPVIHGLVVVRSILLYTVAIRFSSTPFRASAHLTQPTGIISSQNQCSSHSAIFYTDERWQDPVPVLIFHTSFVVCQHGLNTSFIQWIATSVTSSKFSSRVKRDQISTFFANRGIRCSIEAHIQVRDGHPLWCHAQKLRKHLRKSLPFFSRK